MDDISEELQCPVCLLIPREGPIPACPAGHIVCKECRENVATCPTCRRPMSGDGTNTLANKMIERVPHPCKYGCQVKNYLKEIKEHEEICPEIGQSNVCRYGHLTGSSLGTSPRAKQRSIWQR